MFFSQNSLREMVALMSAAFGFQVFKGVCEKKRDVQFCQVFLSYSFTDISVSWSKLSNRLRKLVSLMDLME